MNNIIDKREDWVRVLEDKASLILNLTPDLPNSYEKLQELDNVTFLRRLQKDILPKTNKTVVLAIFEID